MERTRGGGQRANGGGGGPAMFGGRVLRDRRRRWREASCRGDWVSWPSCAGDAAEGDAGNSIWQRCSGDGSAAGDWRGDRDGRTDRRCTGFSSGRPVRATLSGDVATRRNGAAPDGARVDP